MGGAIIDVFASRAGDGHFQYASYEHAGYVDSIIAGAAHIGDRRDDLSRGINRFGDRLVVDALASQCLSSGFGQQRRRCDCAECDTRVDKILPAFIKDDTGTDTNDGDIHLVTRDHAAIMRAAILGPRWKMDLDQQFAFGQYIFAGASAERFGQHFTCA